MTDANFLEYPAPMDREMLKRHLALAEEHIATGEKNIARQRDLIAQLERDGHDTASARTFLRQFEQLQAMQACFRRAHPRCVCVPSPSTRSGHRKCGNAM